MGGSGGSVEDRDVPQSQVPRQGARSPEGQEQPAEVILSYIDGGGGCGGGGGGSGDHGHIQGGKGGSGGGVSVKGQGPGAVDLVVLLNDDPISLARLKADLGQKHETLRRHDDGGDGGGDMSGQAANDPSSVT